eukprot:1161809-Pelagomonas_calceolata.AAC.8
MVGREPGYCSSHLNVKPEGALKVDTHRLILAARDDNQNKSTCQDTLFVTMSHMLCPLVECSRLDMPVPVIMISAAAMSLST